MTRKIIISLSIFLTTGFYGQVKGQQRVNDSLTIEYFDSVYYQNTFSLEDFKFEVGQVYRLERKFLFEHNEFKAQKLSIYFLDSLADFLIDRPRLIVEIGRHTDAIVSERYSKCSSCIMADKIRNELIIRGGA